MGIAPEQSGYPTILITDGRILSENLRGVGRDTTWLRRELQRQGASSAQDVYLLMMDDSGSVYFAARDKKN